jgi:hypothetical protein
MSSTNWISAEAGRDSEPNFIPQPPTADGNSVDRRSLHQSLDNRSLDKFSSHRDPWNDLPAHNFPAGARESAKAEPQGSALDRNPDLWLYRDRTKTLLRRYLRYSLETGRLPSLMRLEAFRAVVTAYGATTFEDRVIFVRDVDKCLSRLGKFEQEVILRIVLQEHTHDQAAKLLHCNRKAIERGLMEALDLLSEDFLRVGLLVPLPSREENER